MRAVVLAAALTALVALARTQIGRIDTVGGTTYDCQSFGPAYRMLVNSPDHGVHVVWMHSAAEYTSYPDRNMRYNFYDYATREWNWLDPDSFMLSGTNVFRTRAGYGNLDADPNTGVALVSAHTGIPLHPVLGRDLMPGGGAFEYCHGSTNASWYQWPKVSVGANSEVHVVLGDATGFRMFYSKVEPWCEFPTPTAMTEPQPDPMFPNYNISASRFNGNTVLTWVYDYGGYPLPGFYRESASGGRSWSAPQNLPWPPAFSADTVPSFLGTGFYPYYDRQNRLHVVSPVLPIVAGMTIPNRLELWHWCRENSPPWTRIIRIEEPRMTDLPANRPSIGEDRAGGLHVVWEQFNPENVEPQTGLPRGDIWWARDDYSNGARWGEPVRLTEPDETSKRYPVVIDYMSEDTLRVCYMADHVAGTASDPNGGAVTENPLLVQHIPIAVPAVSEPGRTPLRQTAGPAVIRGVLNLSGAGHNPILLGESGLCPKPAQLLNASGRKVMDLQPGENDVRHLSPGAYFIRYQSEFGQGLLRFTLVR
ncbi:MAG TPA: hypothetical protein ENN51_05810 [candidate division WOR-3 bacterium]|uniref:Exo-alpha-sialidase n=1 Tax=candidate division WOR-3 bacterium TaxID=2052148 RepID=A0A7V0T5X7_UNCW3|nr:hypothetical protein [candidate division WOR-3 bacterium]